MEVVQKFRSLLPDLCIGVDSMIVEGGLLGFGARGEQEALLRRKVCVFILNALSFSFSKSVYSSLSEALLLLPQSKQKLGHSMN